MIMQILEPSFEGRIRCLLLGGEDALPFSSCAECCRAILLDPFANLRTVELKDVTDTTAPSRMNCLHLLQRLLDELFAKQLAECIENDTIADAQEEVERCQYDALRIDGEETRMGVIDGVTVGRGAIARGLREAVEGKSTRTSFLNFISFLLYERL